MRSSIPSLHHQNFEIKFEIAMIETTECEDRLLTRTPHVCRPLSETQEWSLDAYDPGSPVQTDRYPACNIVRTNNGVCSGKSSLPCRSIFSLPPHHPKSRDLVPRPSPKRASRAFLSLRPRQIMIALISVDSRLSVLSRDIVTRQHERQDNSQKSLSAVGTDEN